MTIYGNGNSYASVKRDGQRIIVQTHTDADGVLSPEEARMFRRYLSRAIREVEEATTPNPTECECGGDGVCTYCTRRQP